MYKLIEVYLYDDNKELFDDFYVTINNKKSLDTEFN